MELSLCLPEQNPTCHPRLALFKHLQGTMLTPVPTCVQMEMGDGSRVEK